MNKHAIVFSALVMMLGCSSTDKPTINGYENIPFRLVGKGIPIVKGKLNGKDAWFIVDTGASSTVINQGVAKQYHLSTYTKYYSKKTEINGLGGSVLFESSWVKLEIGRLLINYPALMSKDLNALFGVITRGESVILAGILGSDILSRFRLNINYENKTLTYRITEQITKMVSRVNNINE